MEWGRIFASHIFDKQLMFTKYNELRQQGIEEEREENQLSHSKNSSGTQTAIKRRKSSG